MMVQQYYQRAVFRSQACPNLTSTRISEPPHAQSTDAEYSRSPSTGLGKFPYLPPLSLLTKRFTHLCATTLSSPPHYRNNSDPSPQTSPLPNLSKNNIFLLTYSTFCSRDVYLCPPPSHERFQGICSAHSDQSRKLES